MSSSVLALCLFLLTAKSEGTNPEAFVESGNALNTRAL